MAEQLTTREVFGFLRPDQLHTISDAADIVRFAAGDTIYQRGAKADHFYAVLSGQVTLRLPGKEGVSINIDELTRGAMFGSCICFNRDSYALTAQCTEDAELLKISGSVLDRLMEEDRTMGYALQSRISEMYYGRYIETMKKLQAIVMNIPIESN
ncbi:MAG: cyclic nucleotide-binding domain-containing protein [Candidatus Latescibacterota bacterium]|nr:MAG: cyclic nucleotide-binding domain-containing protein [Candidatus Latescibacterota bacterium]